jgi:viral phosphatase
VGAVLILWSYGSEIHVAESMSSTGLDNIFDIVITRGSKPGQRVSARTRYDSKRASFFIDTSFKFDLQTAMMPKSPRVVLAFLEKAGVNYVKSLILVDDTKENDYFYDLFILVRRAPEPRADWASYEEKILDFLQQHDSI